MTISVTHSTPADSSFSSTGAAAWNADHTLTGVGTVAEQNANAVAITGGTIDGTVIGNTTPAAGTFTTLTATGQTSLGGVAGSEGLRVLNTASGVNFVSVSGATAGNAPYLASTGTSTNIPLAFYTKGTGAYIFSTGASYAPQFNVSHTASAVNYVQVTGAATGGGTQISSQGSDTNIGLQLRSKGTGAINLMTAGGTNQVVVSNTASSVNYLTLTGSATGVAAKVGVDGSDTNIPLVLQPKGTGALQAQQTDSTATGGNARGANAVDWSTSRYQNNHVASGLSSVLAGGYAQVVSGSYAGVLTGNQNIATAAYSTVVGGVLNNSGGFAAFIGSGQSNSTAGYYNFVGGGFTNSATSGSAVTTQSGTMNATTAVTLSGSNANIKVGQYITGTSIAAETYVAAISGTSLTLSKVASGSSTSTLSFYTPHGVVVGGGNNQATGSYSFIGGGGDAGTAANRNVASGDWSFVGGGQTNVASALQAVVVGGNNNTANSQASFIGGGTSNQATSANAFVGGGFANNATGAYSSIAGGVRGTTRLISGNMVFPAHVNPVQDLNGASQAALLIVGAQTTDATATVLRSNTSAAGTTNQVILPNNSAYYFKGTVVAGVTGGGNTKGWTVEGVIKRGANAASTALVGTPTVLSSYGDAGATTWALTATADTTNGGLAITFTGQAGTTIRTVARLETTEMTF